MLYTIYYCIIFIVVNIFIVVYYVLGYNINVVKYLLLYIMYCLNNMYCCLIFIDVKQPSRAEGEIFIVGVMLTRSNHYGRVCRL